MENKITDADREAKAILTAYPPKDKEFESFACCGGNDADPKEHTFDCFERAVRCIKALASQREQLSAQSRPTVYVPDDSTVERMIAWAENSYNGPTGISEKISTSALRFGIETCIEWMRKHYNVVTAAPLAQPAVAFPSEEDFLLYVSMNSWDANSLNFKALYSWLRSQIKPTRLPEKRTVREDSLGDERRFSSAYNQAIDDAEKLNGKPMPNISVDDLMPTKDEVEYGLADDYWAQRERGIQGQEIIVSHWSQVYEKIRSHVSAKLKELYDR